MLIWFDHGNQNNDTSEEQTVKQLLIKSLYPENIHQVNRVEIVTGAGERKIFILSPTYIDRTDIKSSRELAAQIQQLWDEQSLPTEHGIEE